MMYARRIRAAISAISAVSLALAAFALLGFARIAAAADQVPFHGRLVGVVTRGVANPPFVPVLIEGVGNASHLGRFTFSAPHTVNLATRTAEGTYEFTAANGDMLFADFVGQSYPTDTPGVVYIVEEATITGGTGRFAGATGSFTVERLYDTVAGTTIGTFEGTISSGGARKR